MISNETLLKSKGFKINNVLNIIAFLLLLFYLFYPVKQVIKSAVDGSLINILRYYGIEFPMVFATWIYWDFSFVSDNFLFLKNANGFMWLFIGIILFVSFVIFFYSLIANIKYLSNRNKKCNLKIYKSVSILQLILSILLFLIGIKMILKDYPCEATISKFSNFHAIIGGVLIVVCLIQLIQYIILLRKLNKEQKGENV